MELNLTKYKYLETSCKLKFGKFHLNDEQKKELFDKLRIIKLLEKKEFSSTYLMENDSVIKVNGSIEATEGLGCFLYPSSSDYKIIKEFVKIADKEYEEKLKLKEKNAIGNKEQSKVQNNLEDKNVPDRIIIKDNSVLINYYNGSITINKTEYQKYSEILTNKSQWLYYDSNDIFEDLDNSNLVISDLLEMDFYYDYSLASISATEMICNDLDKIDFDLYFIPFYKFILQCLITHAKQLELTIDLHYITLFKEITLPQVFITDKDPFIETFLGLYLYDQATFKNSDLLSKSFYRFFEEINRRR